MIMAKKEKKQLGFELKNGDTYVFSSPQFRMRFDDNGVPAEEGLSRIVTAEEASKDAKICARLVDIKSGVIKKVTSQPKAKNNGTK